METDTQTVKELDDRLRRGTATKVLIDALYKLQHDSALDEVLQQTLKSIITLTLLTADIESVDEAAGDAEELKDTEEVISEEPEAEDPTLDLPWSANKVAPWD